MLLGAILFWLSVSVPAPVAQAAPADLHVILKSEFEYMARVRPAQQDWWLRDRQRAFTQGDRMTVFREDLGVVWRIDTKAGTYSESKLPTSAPPAAHAVDMHTVGYSWEAEYEWDIRETGRESTIAGRPCREFSATGQADYAEAWVTFWGCTPPPGGLPSPTDIVTGILRSESASRMIRTTASEQGLWILQVEEKQEPAIAPTMINRVKVDLLDATAAPGGTFELPSTIKRAGR